LVEIKDNNIKYQVHTVNGNWLPAMIGTHDTAGSSNAFAGNYSNIDAV